MQMSVHTPLHMSVRMSAHMSVRMCVHMRTPEEKRNTRHVTGIDSAKCCRHVCYMVRCVYVARIL